VVIVVAGLIVWWVNGKKQIEIIKRIPPVFENKSEIREIKIALTADIHNDWGEFSKVVKMTKESGDELVVVVGDMTVYGKGEELEKAKSELINSGIKYAVVPGNHDAYRSLAGKNIYDGVFSKRYQVVRIDDLKLILIDNSNYRGLGTDQWSWIKKEVIECKRLLCLAVMHMPLNNSFSTHLMGENNAKVTAEAKKLLGLLVDNGVRQIEAGHLHYATSYELEGIRTDIVGAISRERNTQSPRYTELVIRGNEIERKVMEVEE